MKIISFLASGIIATASLASMPAGAQQAATPGAPRPKPIEAPGEIAKRAPINGVLVLYGNERCPTNTDGDEIVICERRSAQEQFRVPKELRELQITPENESWAARADSTLSTGTGVNGIGSCSTIGAGGQTGCFTRRVRESKRENAARQSQAPVLP